MNAMLTSTMLATAGSYPAALDRVAATTAASPHQMRRRTISGFSIDQTEVDRFNRLLSRLGRTQAPFERDQLATAGRELCDGSVNPLPGIAQRMRRAAAAALMITDPAWETANDVALLATLVVEYIRAKNDLLPDRLPRVGRLDDVIVVDTAWPALGDEVDNYLHYRRLRRIEARLRGCNYGDFEFSREQWQQALQAEIAFAAAHRDALDHFHVPTHAVRFQVH
ncbi:MULTISPECIES: hypothetical protein [unclassified Lysobacter]